MVARGWVTSGETITGTGTPTTNIPENHLVTVDANGNLVDSGFIKEQDKLVVEELQTSVGSLYVGKDQHKMASGGENILFTNLATGHNYAPVWQEYDIDSVNDAVIRVHGDLKSDVVRQSDKSTVIVNPNFVADLLPDNITWYKAKYNMVEAQDDVKITIYIDGNPHPLWSYVVDHIDIGEQVFTFQSPVDLKARVKYRVVITSDKGDVKVYGNASGEPARSLWYRPFNDLPVYPTNDSEQTDMVTWSGTRIAEAIKSGRATSIASKVDCDKKQLTLQLKSDDKILDTDIIDLSCMFTNNPTDLKDFYYGMSSTQIPVESIVKAGKGETLTSAVGYDCIVDRTDSDSKYMYVWFEDDLDKITGFKFGAFTATWQKANVTVDGKSGIVYYSDNPTRATHIEWEIV